MKKQAVAAVRINQNLSRAIYDALDLSGILGMLASDSIVAMKPNFTYPYHKPGITTSPEVLEQTIGILRQITSRIAIVETEGGYGAWKASEAFAGHGVYELKKKYGIEAVNLNEEPAAPIKVSRTNREYTIMLPTRLLHDTDVLISMPVPKIHCMTGLSLSYKNQWGCIPDIMRLRKHYIFSDAIVAINRALRPAVLADGRYFLDQNGPMAGEPIPMDLIIAGSNVGAFDLYVSELMGYSWTKVPHLKRAVALGDMPSKLDDLTCNILPSAIKKRDFVLRRTFRNYIALAGFKSRFITWLGYEAWFGRVLLHKILYAVAGKPVKPSA